ncbi:hypothetical protein KUCAC02_003548 [Chaenocephalus aceratus]|uniref:Uncharacterized protein n=1 Tax=Chaenocephalus aceratus TaxID=36190 RepID=A0ACB9WLT8_CHAAC|nr:hypothetical protein KUCAC02_003548 [Chaenocephalus aceratus]
MNMTIAEAVQLPSCCLRKEGGSYITHTGTRSKGSCTSQTGVSATLLCGPRRRRSSSPKTLHGMEISSSWNNSTPSICSLCWPVERRTFK